MTTNVKVILELSEHKFPSINETFQIDVRFRDLINNRGVFSGFLDFNFDPEAVRVDSITYAPIYNGNPGEVLQTGTFLPGVIDELGATANINQIFENNQLIIPQDDLIFTLNMTALRDLNIKGTTVITDEPDLPLSEIVIFGNNNDQRANTEYASLTIGNITNTPPTISNINNRNIRLGSEQTTFNFTISDIETKANELNITAISNNQTLVPNQNIIISGTDQDRTLNLNLPNEIGTTTITLTVSDGELSSSETFDLTIKESTQNQSAITIQDQNKSLTFSGKDNDIFDLSEQNSDTRDRLFSGSGNDTIYLGSNDFISGGNGNDKLFVATGGGNILVGGAGSDQFWLANENLANALLTEGALPTLPNLITNFKKGEDKIGINGFGVNVDNFNANFDSIVKPQTNGNTNININDKLVAIILGFDHLTGDDFIFNSNFSI